MRGANLCAHRLVYLFWSGMDAFYICLYVVRSAYRGAVPFWTDFNDAMVSMQNWGGGLELLVWLSLILQLSLFATCVLFFLCCRVAIYLALVQTPFRVFFVVPSASTILLWPMLVSGISNSVWLGLMLLSEGCKGWSLWWLQRSLNCCCLK